MFVVQCCAVGAYEVHTMMDRVLRHRIMHGVVGLRGCGLAAALVAVHRVHRDGQRVDGAPAVACASRMCDAHAAT